MQVTLNGLQFWYDEVANYSAGQELLREGRKHGSIGLIDGTGRRMSGRFSR